MLKQELIRFTKPYKYNRKLTVKNKEREKAKK